MRAVEELIENIANQSSKRYFDFVLFKDGRDLYESLDGEGGYKGVMIESPHYIGIRLREVSNEAIVNASYYAEELITELIQLDLGTCWVTLKDASLESRSQALGEENKRIAYLISFGQPRPRNPFDTVPANKSSRDSLDQLVFKDRLGEKIDQSLLEDRGLDDFFYYLRFAPSTMNSQPWNFVLKNDQVDLYIREVDGRINFMDAGIIMYYFRALANYIGLHHHWDLDRDLNADSREGEYKKIGTYNL